MAVKLEDRQVHLKMTLARISGAAKVLEELLHPEATDELLSDRAPTANAAMAA